VCSSDLIPALRSLITEFQTDPIYGVFAVQGLTAHSWYQGDEPSINQIFSVMVESIIGKRASVGSAVRDALDRVTAVLNQNQGSAAWIYPKAEENKKSSGGVFGM
jgi:hypothetical protein